MSTVASLPYPCLLPCLYPCLHRCLHRCLLFGSVCRQKFEWVWQGFENRRGPQAWQIVWRLLFICPNQLEGGQLRQQLSMHLVFHDEPDDRQRFKRRAPTCIDHRLPIAVAHTAWVLSEFKLLPELPALKLVWADEERCQTICHACGPRRFSKPCQTHSKFCQQTEPESKQMSLYISRHYTYFYIYIYIYLCVCVCARVCLLISGGCGFVGLLLCARSFSKACKRPLQ